MGSKTYRTANAETKSESAELGMNTAGAVSIVAAYLTVYKALCRTDLDYFIRFTVKTTLASASVKCRQFTSFVIRSTQGT